MKKDKVLFICTHNSARSQMAEGFLRSYFSHRYEAYSAGTEPSGINPYAVRVMAEIGIDISTHRSKGLNEFLDKELDYVVTVCDHAKESCPFFPGGQKMIHQSFEDPSSHDGDEDKMMVLFRRVRDKIWNWIDQTFGEGGQKRAQE